MTKMRQTARGAPRVGDHHLGFIECRVEDRRRVQDASASAVFYRIASSIAAAASSPMGLGHHPYPHAPPPPHPGGGPAAGGTGWCPRGYACG